MRDRLVDVEVVRVLVAAECVDCGSAYERADYGAPGLKRPLRGSVRCYLCQSAAIDEDREEEARFRARQMEAARAVQKLAGGKRRARWAEEEF